jgi:hypothetical protein
VTVEGDVPVPTHRVWSGGVPLPPHTAVRAYGNSVPDENVPGIEATSFGVTEVFVSVTFV